MHEGRAVKPRAYGDEGTALEPVRTDFLVNEAGGIYPGAAKPDRFDLRSPFRINPSVPVGPSIDLRPVKAIPVKPQASVSMIYLVNVRFRRSTASYRAVQPPSITGSAPVRYLATTVAG